MNKAERSRRTGDLRTKGFVSAAVLLLIGVTDAFAHPRLLALTIVGYLTLTVLFWDLSSRVVEWRRIRAVPMVLDIVVISVVVWSTGGIESSWYLLYLLTILSAARYLGAHGSLQVTALATACYAIACLAAGGSLPDLYPFGIRAIMLMVGALTAARPPKARERAEEKLLRAIEIIDREILADSDMDTVAGLILEAAMEVTVSELSAIRLADGYEKAATNAKEDAGVEDIAAAALVVRQYYDSVAKSRQLMTLPRPDLAPRYRSGAEGWTARLVPLVTGDTCVGVLGVFSRRRLQYTHDDQRRLLTLAHLIPIAQKNVLLAHRNAQLAETNAQLYAESRARLKMLYEVGEGLKSEQSLELLFQNVVEMVSTHLGSEEAALFLPGGGDEPGMQHRTEPLKKRAVAGPGKAVEERLGRQHEVYGGERSLSRTVFDGREAVLDNDVDPGEPNATAYAALLPSGIIRHYLGVPLMIGDEVMGVIRVLNKKARGYAPAAGAACLAEEGFDEGDRGLLSAIATQVAAAIRNARFVEQRAYFRNLVYESPDPMIVLDGLGYVQNFNHQSQRLWGVTEEEVLGTHVSTLYESPEHATKIGKALWAAARHGRGITGHSTSIRRRGGAGDEIIPIRLSATGFLDGKGRRTGSIGVFSDEREVIRRMEETIQTKQLAAVGQVAQTKGHDIKTHLGTVRSWAEILRDEAADPDTLEACAAIENAVSKAVAKLNDLLMAADPTPPKLEQASLRRILATFEAGIQHEARSARIHFRLRYPGDDHILLADTDQMRQLFANLFGNSLDAIKEARDKQGRPGGTIAVDVTSDEKEVLLSWTDDGSGMSEEELAKAFAPLFTTKETGSGLGLFIAKTIVERHGGRIGVEAVREGGVRFSIQLPFVRIIRTAETAAEIMRSAVDTLEGGSGP